MVLLEQLALLLSTLFTFVGLLAGLKYAIRTLSLDRWEVFDALNQATQFPSFISDGSFLSRPLRLFSTAKMSSHTTSAQVSSSTDNSFALAFIIGIVIALVAYQLITAKNTAKPVLDPAQWQKFKLMEKQRISDNTALYRFRLPHNDSYLGLPIGQHISVQADVDGKKVARSYTPTSSDDDKGFFDLVIKSYPQGNVSRAVGELKVGQSLEFKGPKGQMRYSPGLCRRIGMIAGGTGITPCLQIIRAAMKNPQDKTKIDLIYANVKETDILLKEELDREAKAHPDKFTVHYFLNEPPQGWQGGEGFVSKDAIKEKLPAPADDIKILMCGPPPMINAMKKHLEELGYEKPRTVSKLEDQVFCF